MPRKPSIARQAQLLCANMPDGSEKDRAIELATNVLFLEKKLGETRKIANTQPAVVEYDNGGGQSGTRVSPWVNSYTTLLKSYQASIKQLSEMLKGDEDGGEDPLDALASKYGKMKPSIEEE